MSLQPGPTCVSIQDDENRQEANVHRRYKQLVLVVEHADTDSTIARSQLTFDSLQEASATTLQPGWTDVCWTLQPAR